MAYLNKQIEIKFIIYVLYILTFFKDSFSWNEELKKNTEIKSSNAYNPLCWITDCNKNEVTKERESLPLNPRCLFTQCDETQKTQLNPVCWFTECRKNKEESHWLTDEEVIQWSKEKYQKIKCWFKECSKEVPKPKETELGFFEKMAKYLNAAKPQELVVQKIFQSEYSPYCWISECCNKDSIPGDTKKLHQTMDEYLYGQHLTRTVIDAIDAHWNLNVKPAKALVLSFHGSVGVGKNYLATLIAKSLFKLETKSKYVHHFTGRLDFPLENERHIYRQNLYNWLKSNITQCPRQLFIFDEIEYMPSGVLNDIKPVLDYREVVDGADYREAIFIFVSNIGAGEIKKKYEELRQDGKTRKDILPIDFENLIEKGAFEHEGGLYNSDIIKSNLIDHYIPFLPLEEEQVQNCIKIAFLTRDIKEPQEDDINAVMKTMSWIPLSGTRFSLTGCKNIASKVGVIAKKYHAKRDMNTEL